MPYAFNPLTGTFDFYKDPTPGGTSGQVQFNNSGVLGGVSTTAVDGSGNLTFSGGWIQSTNGAVSTPPMSLTGTWYNGGTSTTTKPQLLIEPTGSTSTSWNTAGTGLGINGPSGFGGDLLWTGVNGSTCFRVSNASGIHLSIATFVGVSLLASSGRYSLSATGLTFRNDAVLGSSASTYGSPPDTILRRDDANTWAQRNGTAAQTIRFYNTWTSATDYERLAFKWESNVFRIQPEAAGTGVVRPLQFPANGLASTPPVALTGTWFTGGTSTTTKPQFLIEPTGTTTSSWSTAGTGLGVNAPSGFGGDLAWFGVGGSRIFSVNNVDAGTVVISRENANHGIRLSRSGLNPGSCIWQVNSFGSCQFSADSSIFFNGSAVASVAFGLGNTEYLKLLNNTLLGFGSIPGNSGNASFPGLKRSGTALQVRLSDDSAYTTIDAQHRLQGVAPASATAVGTAGDIRHDTDYIYICTATNTWKRAAISTW